MKYYKWISLLFAAALTMGACSDDENNYGSSGVSIEIPVTTETTLKSVSLSCTFNLQDDVRYVSPDSATVFMKTLRFMTQP